VADKNESEYADNVADWREIMNFLPKDAKVYILDLSRSTSGDETPKGIFVCYEKYKVWPKKTDNMRLEEVGPETNFSTVTAVAIY